MTITDCPARFHSRTLTTAPKASIHPPDLAPAAPESVEDVASPVDSLDPSLLEALTSPPDDEMAFTPEGQYDHKQTVRKGTSETTIWYGGRADHIPVFRSTDSPTGQQRTRHNVNTGALEGTWTFDKKTGAETIHLPDGTEMRRNAAGQTTGRDSFGDRMSARDAQAAWESERTRFDPPQPKAVKM